MNAVTSSTIYGAAGADTLTLGATAEASTLDLGTGVADVNLAGVTASTIIGAAGNDSFDFSGGVSNTSIVGGDGVNTFTPAASLISSTITSGSSNDTFTLAGVASSSWLAEPAMIHSVPQPLVHPLSWVVLVPIRLPSSLVWSVIPPSISVDLVLR